MRYLTWTAVVLITLVTPVVAGPTTSPATQPAELDAEVVLEELGDDFRPLVETLANGEIDWTRGIVIATGSARGKGHGGQARAAATGAARMVAARNAVLLLAELRTGGQMKMGQLRSGRISVDAVLKDFEQLDTHFDPDKREATVRLRATLLGAKGVVTVQRDPNAGQADAWPWPEGIAGAADTVDGVVIDARGHDLTPALLPTVLAANGQRLFGPADVPANQRTHRLAIYVFTKRSGPTENNPVPQLGVLGKAKETVARISGDPELREAVSRVFAEPLMLRATGVDAETPSTLILAETADRHLMLQPSARECFKTGRVLIVTNVKLEADD